MWNFFAHAHHPALLLQLPVRATHGRCSEPRHTILQYRQKWWWKLARRCGNSQQMHDYDANEVNTGHRVRGWSWDRRERERERRARASPPVQYTTLLVINTWSWQGRKTVLTDYTIISSHPVQRSRQYSTRLTADCMDTGRELVKSLSDETDNNMMILSFLSSRLVSRLLRKSRCSNI